MNDKMDSMEGDKEFIHALLTGQRIWPNCYGQDVAAAAFFIHEDRMKYQREINRLRKEIKQAIPAMREFAVQNSLFTHEKVIQDPCGVHAWLNRNMYLEGGGN